MKCIFDQRQKYNKPIDAMKIFNRLVKKENSVLTELLKNPIAAHYLKSGIKT